MSNYNLYFLILYLKKKNLILLWLHKITTDLISIYTSLLNNQVLYLFCWVGVGLFTGKLSDITINMSVTITKQTFLALSLSSTSVTFVTRITLSGLAICIKGEKVQSPTSIRTREPLIHAHNVSKYTTKEFLYFLS